MQVKEILAKTLDTSYRESVMVTLTQVLYWNRVNYKSFLYTVCKEFYSMIPITIFFPRNSYLVENFNRKLERFEAAGLINYWASAHTDMKYLDFKSVNLGPRKLIFSQLQGPAQMLTAGLILSTVLFLIELFWYKVEESRVLKWLKKLKSKN